MVRAHELIRECDWLCIHSLLCLFREYSNYLRPTGVYRHSNIPKLGDGPTDLCVIEMNGVRDE